MHSTKISLCYHPTTIILVDDKKDYLSHLYAYLSGENELLSLPYTSPKKALDYLNKQHKSDPFIYRCMKNDEDSTEHFMVDFDIKAIRNEMYNPNRFKEITLAVVDYDMPIINGTGFCEQIENKQIKKLMLTGAGDKDLAVQLFNNGTIDNFILKNVSDLLSVLRKNIILLQQQYFVALSEKIITKNSEFFFKPLLYCFNNSAYMELFNQFYQKINAVEYYLLDNQGSFLFLDKNANPSWFITASEEQMKAYQMIAEDGDETPRSVLKAIKDRSHLPYFHTADDRFTLTSQDEWSNGNYLHPAQRLPGKELYYYTYITAADAYDI